MALQLGGVSSLRRDRPVAAQMMAKKKGGGKKGGKKGGKQKESGFAWASNFELKPFESSELRALAESVVNAYQAKTGKPLDKTLVGASDVPKKLWTAPTAVMVTAEGAAPAPAEEAVAAEEEEAPDEPAVPVALCTYANRAALEAFGFGDDYNKLIGQPTELPATSADKYQSGYTKKLKAGKQAFTFEGARTLSSPRAQRKARQLATLPRPPAAAAAAAASSCVPVSLARGAGWVLEKAAVVDGKLAMEALGVAYCFEEWALEDGTICAAGGQRREPELTPEQVAAAVEAQGVEVRRLKEEEGLGNKDPAVMVAVAELLRLKALLPPEESA